MCLQHGISLYNLCPECEAFSANACTKNTAVSTGCEPHPSPTPPVELAQMMGLGGYLPGVDPSLLHYTYPGLPGYLHNMTTLPFLPPGLLSGERRCPIPPDQRRHVNLPLIYGFPAYKEVLSNFIPL